MQIDRLYIGSTGDLSKRLKYHNNGKVKSTRPYIPYTMVYTEEYKTKTEALKREKQIKKSGKLRKIIREQLALSSNG